MKTKTIHRRAQAGYIHFTLRLMERYGMFITEQQYEQLYDLKGKKLYESKKGTRLIEKVIIKDRQVIIAKNTKVKRVCTVLPINYKEERSERKRLRKQKIK